MSERRDFLKLFAATPLLLSGISFAADEEELPLKTVRGQLQVNGQAAGNSLKLGDTLGTTDNEAVLVLGKDAYKLQPDTRIEVRRADDGVTGILKILSGAMLAVFNKADKEIVTPTASIGIRGTGVYLNVDSEVTYFCACFGKTNLVPQAGESELIEVEHHTSRVISHTDVPVISKGTMYGHNDAELRELAALAGVTLPKAFASESR